MHLRRVRIVRLQRSERFYGTHAAFPPFPDPFTIYRPRRSRACEKNLSASRIAARTKNHSTLSFLLSVCPLPLGGGSAPREETCPDLMIRNPSPVRFSVNQKKGVTLSVLLSKDSPLEGTCAPGWARQRRSFRRFTASRREKESILIPSRRRERERFTAQPVTLLVIHAKPRNPRSSIVRLFNPFATRSRLGV